MDTDIADQKLEDLHIEETTVKTGAGARATGQYDIDLVREKALLRKLDMRVVPVLWFLFMLAFLDRTNIGNARIQGMTADLNMQGNDYNNALFIFPVTYILLRSPVEYSDQACGTIHLDYSNYDALGFLRFLTHEEKELLVARLAADVADAKMN